MNREANLNFCKVFIEFYKFCVTVIQMYEKERFKIVEKFFGTEAAIYSNLLIGNYLERCFNYSYPILGEKMDMGRYTSIYKDGGEFFIDLWSDKNHNITMDLEWFLKDIGSYEWIEKFREITKFKGSSYLQNVLEDGFADYRTFVNKTNTPRSRWRENHLFNDADISEMISDAGFRLLYNPFIKRFKVEDKEQANLGNIEGETFKTLKDVMHRMEVYWIDMYDEEKEF